MIKISLSVNPIETYSNKSGKIVMSETAIPMQDTYIIDFKRFQGLHIWNNAMKPVAITANDDIVIKTPVGMFENTPYPGIHDVLATLKKAGHRLYVATSKPETMATAILQKFSLDSYFDRICGATMDGSRDSKEDVIAYLLEQIDSPGNAVMIGDTIYDVIGATVHGIPTIGVSWGYGNPSELLEAGALAVADSPSQLTELLNK